MKHRIVILGAGYAGAFSAGYLARQLHADDFELTVVNAEPDFVERLRLHQLAAGQDLRHRPLTDIFAGTGIRLRVARVSDIDPAGHSVTVVDDSGVDHIHYDTLLYALGSTAAVDQVHGVAEHAFHVAARPAALRLRRRLSELGEDGTVLVVGGNLTAIEAVTEIAEAHPHLRVGLATRGEAGGWLGPKARRHLFRAFDRLGVTVHEHTTIDQVDATAAITADGTGFAADAVVWAAGFAVHPIAAASGLEVRPNGQIVVDRQMRSVSHPDVYVAGDSAFVVGDNGRPLPMSCASAGSTSMQAVGAIIGDRTGRDIATNAQPYVGNHISLGRKDGIFQLVDSDAHARSWALCGRTAARVKTTILDTAAWSLRHPTFGRPGHNYRSVSRPQVPGLVAG